MSARNSTICIARNIKIDSDYKNTLALSQSDIQSLCQSNAVYIGSDYSFLRTENRIKIQAPFSQIFPGNYCYIVNQGILQFFFVKEVKYIADSTTEIIVDEDVITTYKNAGFGTVYVQRQHTQDDSVRNFAQEKLNFDRYVCNKWEAIDVFPTQIICEYSESGKGNGEYEAPNSTDIIPATDRAGMQSVNLDKEVPSMLYTQRRSYSATGLNSAVTHYYDNFIKYGHGSSLLGVTTAPTPGETTVAFNLASKLDNYTPKNNKCLQYPYYYINFTNNRGQSNMLKPELFASGQASFEKVSIDIGQPISMAYPLTYNGLSKGYNQALTIDYPAIPMTVDSYSSYMGQRGAEVMSGVVGSAISGGIGLISGNPLMAGLGFAGSAASALSSLAFEPDNQGDGVIGSASANYLNLAINNFKFRIEHMTLTAQDAKRLDDYFTAYGYAQNEIQQIYTTNPRFHCHHVQTMSGECVIEGIPHDKADIINNAFAQGITFWDSNENVGNYSLK